MNTAASLATLARWIPQGAAGPLSTNADLPIDVHAPGNMPADSMPVHSFAPNGSAMSIRA